MKGKAAKCRRETLIEPVRSHSVRVLLAGLGFHKGTMEGRSAVWQIGDSIIK
jgi:hypothetical protein